MLCVTATAGEGCCLLSSFVFTADLLLNFPVRKGIFVAAPRTLPSAFNGISPTLMKHFDDEVTMKTHRRMAEDRFFLSRLIHDCHFLTSSSACRGSLILRANGNYAETD